MRITRLGIGDLRILESVELEPAPGINVITGGNGAGKTTLLEAIYLLGHGRSFRHPEAGPLIRHGQQWALVTARLLDDGGTASHLGLRRGRQAFTARRNGEAVRRRSELLRQLPVQLLLPASHELVEKGPEWRRRFLDQGLFHVEHSYHQQMLEYGKALRQRNAAIRMGDLALVRSFDPLLAEPGERFTQLRAEFVRQLQEGVNRILGKLEAGYTGVVLQFRQGWSPACGLLEALEQHQAADLRLGFTGVGPHRAEVRFLVEGRPASRLLSRGQQKLLIYSLTLAYLDLVRKKELETPVLLIDDLEAELDARRIDTLVSFLEEQACQVFVTVLPGGALDSAGFRMFHVEQGQVAKA